MFYRLIRYDSKVNLRQVKHVTYEEMVSQVDKVVLSRSQMRQLRKKIAKDPKLKHLLNQTK